MRGKTNSRVLGIVVLALSVGVNVLQAQKIRAMASLAGNRGALVGTKAVPFDARGLDGHPARVVFEAGLPTVLYYFSPSCGWCERNWANLEALAAGAQGRYRVLALTSARDVKAYVEKHDLGVEMLVALSDEALNTYRFSATPHTVIVDAYGLVTHEWRGAFVNGIANQIEDLFGLVLPGLSPPPAIGQPK